MAYLTKTTLTIIVTPTTDGATLPSLTDSQDAVGDAINKISGYSVVDSIGTIVRSTRYSLTVTAKNSSYMNLGTVINTLVTAVQGVTGATYKVSGVNSFTNIYN